MANMLLVSDLKHNGAMPGGGRSCPCCTGAGARNTGSMTRKIMRRTARRREERQWRSEMGE